MSPPGQGPYDKFQSTIRTPSDLGNNISQAVLFGSKGNSYTFSTQSDMCICTHILHNIETLVEQKK